jgi:hypothetical protein
MVAALLKSMMIVNVFQSPFQGFSVPTEKELTTLQPRTGAVYSAFLSILQIDNVLILYFGP